MFIAYSMRHEAIEKPYFMYTNINNFKTFIGVNWASFLTKKFEKIIILKPSCSQNSKAYLFHNKANYVIRTFSLSKFNIKTSHATMKSEQETVYGLISYN